MGRNHSLFVLASVVFVLAFCTVPVEARQKAPQESAPSSRRSPKRKKSSSGRAKKFSPLNPWSFLVTGVGSLQRQGKRELQTTPDSLYNVSEFKGVSPFLALGVEYNFSSVWSARFSLVRRQTHVEGNAVPEGSTTLYKFLLEQQFLGAELGVRYTPSVWPSWSFILFGEVAKATEASLTVLEGPPVDGSGIEKPLYVTFAGGVLYNWRFMRNSPGKNWSIEPGLRLGAIVTAIPVMFLTEGMISLKW